VTAHAKWEYVKVIYPRYRQAPRREKQQLLDECCRITRYHRKHVVRLLNGPAPSDERPRARRRPRWLAGRRSPPVIASWLSRRGQQLGSVGTESSSDRLCPGVGARHTDGGRCQI